MVKHREIFAEGAAKQGISRAKADEIFDYMEKFAGYGFNKSHAAAYALISYQTAWLKAHYPAEFIAATMSSELDNTDQLKVFFDDAQSSLNGITFLPPDINESDYRFVPDGQKHIRYALGAIKGTGEAAVADIVAARKAGGKFKDLFDFCERVGKQHVNRRTIEALIRGGAFDSIEPNRAMLLANVELAMNHAEQKADNANQGGLFDMVEDAIEALTFVPHAPWSEAEQLAEEKQAVGFYLSGHPFSPYAGEVRELAKTPLAQLRPQEGSVRVAGFATGIRSIMGKRGRVVFIQLEDDSGKAEVTVAGELLDELPRETLKSDQILVCDCRISADTFSSEGGLRIHANSVLTLNQARCHYAAALTLHLEPRHDIAALAELLRPHTDPAAERRIPVRLNYRNRHAAGSLMPAAQWRTAPSPELLAALETLLGNRAVQIDR